MIVGIDPGQSGGVAYIDLEGCRSWAEPMPTLGKDIDAYAVSDWLRDWQPDTVIVEKVHSMPKQGVVSMFRFGLGFGRILGVLEALAIPYRLVTPQEWKRVVLAGTAKDKDAAIAFARRAYPHIDLTPGRKRTPHDGIADAVCLADYGRQLIGRG